MSSHHRWPPALLLVGLLVVQTTASNAQPTTALRQVGQSVVEMVVNPKGEKKGPFEVKCVVLVRLVSGPGATYRSSTTGKVAQLRNPNTIVCQDLAGNLLVGTSTEVNT